MKKILALLAAIGLTLAARAADPSGLVEVVGVSASNVGDGTAGYPGNSDLQMFMDGYAGTYYGIYVGSGTNITVVGEIFAPGYSSYLQYKKELDMTNFSMFYGASTVGTGGTVFDVIPDIYETTNQPAYPYYSRGTLYERLLPSGVTGSSFWGKAISGGGYSSLGKLRFVATASSATPLDSRPLPPVVTPAGWHCTGNTTPLITITDATTSAQIYLRFDGQPPTNTDLLYTGPFSMTLAGASNLTARAYDPFCTNAWSDVFSNENYAAVFSTNGFLPNENWCDAGDVVPANSLGFLVRGGGALIEGHGGCFLDNRSRDGFLYWYGEYDNMAEASPQIYAGFGIWCYRSTDGLNWYRFGLAQDCNNGQLTYIQRPKINYNAVTGDYVSWSHILWNGSAYSAEASATSSLPTGPFVYITTNLFTSKNPGDVTSFVDNTGAAYLYYASNSPSYGIWATQLDPTWTTNIGSAVLVTNGNREAPVVFTVNGFYFCVDSVGNYYDSTKTFNLGYSWANSPMGPWNYGGALIAPADPLNLPTLNPTNLFNAQSAFVFNPPWGTPFGHGSLILACDRWHNGNQNGNDPLTLFDSRYVFYNLAATGNVLSVSLITNGPGINSTNGWLPAQPAARGISISP